MSTLSPMHRMKKLMLRRFRTAGLLTVIAVAMNGVAAAADLGNIWLVGDSITAGFTVAGGYRPELYSDLTAAGDTFRFVGSSTVDSTPLLDVTGQDHHDGHSGQLIATASLPDGSLRPGLYDNITAYFNSTVASQGRPDIILLMIGLNDMNNNVDIAGAPARLDLLVERILGLDPGARLLVASINPALQGNLYMDPSVVDVVGAIRNYNASIPGIVASHSALGKNVTFVDAFAGLTTADLGSDGLHPSAEGYNRLGDVFAAALSVPEPASYLLLVSGLGLVGFATRRRRHINLP